MQASKDHERGTLNAQPLRHPALDSVALTPDLALQVPGHQADALTRRGIEALQNHAPHRAFLYLSNAIRLLPEHSELYALLACSALEQKSPEQAVALLQDAWQQNPHCHALNRLRWKAHQQVDTPEELQRRILAQLADIEAPDELRQLIALLQGLSTCPPTLGVVSYHPREAELRGWAIDLRSPEVPVHLSIQADGREYSTTADMPNPLLSQAGLAQRCGGIRIKVPASDLRLRILGNGQELLGSPLALSAPLPHTTPTHATDRQQPVNVLIPVYRGLGETLECLDSVLRNSKNNRTPHRLIVLDDATPDEELRQRLQEFASQGQIHYLRHHANLGFIRSMNRGMLLHPQSDVVWLNADTRVHGDWLDRLHQAAYQADDIASVTPFSNNGELMSFPASRVSNPMPSAAEQAELDRLASALGQPAVEIETGCGFCLYIKRQALDDVGYLDEMHLLRGYGEETDWCLRAQSRGWRHMGATHLFVAHQGGVSFGEEKILRVAHNNALLRRRYPWAERRFQAFCKHDPLREARQGLQHARLHNLASSLKRERKTCQLTIARESESQAPLRLEHRNHGQIVRAHLRIEHAGLPLQLDYDLPADHERLVTDLSALPLTNLIFQLREHCPRQLLDLPQHLHSAYAIVACDDTLLGTDDRDLLDFASGARHVRLPWSSLLPRYKAALPQAELLPPDEARPALPAPTKPGQTLLIADSLETPGIGQRWLELARRLRRQRSELLLLVAEDTPWASALIGTAAAYRLPDIAGLSPAECLRLADCRIAVSLDSAPRTGWAAPACAQRLGLPLYAPASAIASEAGAHPLAQLPIADGLSDAIS